MFGKVVYHGVEKATAEAAAQAHEVFGKVAKAIEAAGLEYIHHMIPYLVGKPKVVRDNNAKAQAKDEGCNVWRRFRIFETPLARLPGLVEGAGLSLVACRAVHDALVLLVGDCRQGSAPRAKLTWCWR